jgi:hypothetical protein
MILAWIVALFQQEHYLLRTWAATVEATSGISARWRRSSLFPTDGARDFASGRRVTPRIPAIRLEESCSNTALAALAIQQKT